MEFDLPKDFVAVLKYLRESEPGIVCIEGVVAEKRVDIFKGQTATDLILSTAFKEKFPSLQVNEKKDAHEILQTLLESGAFVPVSQSRGRYYQPSMIRRWNDDSMYAWIYQGSQFYNILLGILAVSCVIAIFMYPLWPSPLKTVAWYVLMALASFVGFILILSIIRLIVFVISYFIAKPGLWLFPNLYADVGFFESFMPLYSWNQ